MFYSHVEFKRLWTSKIPGAYVQGTVDWKGELHPAFARLLKFCEKPRRPCALMANLFIEADVQSPLGALPHPPCRT